MKRNVLMTGVGNRLVAQRALGRQRDALKERLRNVRGTVDNSPPISTKMGHIRRNAKRALAEAERLIQMQRDNELLVMRLSDIIAREPKSTDADYKYHMEQTRLMSNVDARERERRRIQRENQALLQRIQASESSYNLDRILDDWEVNEELARRVAGSHVDQTSRLLVGHDGTLSSGEGSARLLKKSSTLPGIDATGGGGGGGVAVGGTVGGAGAPSDRKALKKKRRKARREAPESIGPSTSALRPEWNSDTSLYSKAGSRLPRRSRKASEAASEVSAETSPVSRTRGEAPHASELREQWLKDNRKHAKGKGKGKGKRGAATGASDDDSAGVLPPELLQSADDVAFQKKLASVQSGGRLGKAALPARSKAKGGKRKGKARGGSEAEHVSASRIQAIHRGRRDRRRVAEIRAEKGAVRRLQSGGADDLEDSMGSLDDTPSGSVIAGGITRGHGEARSQTNSDTGTPVPGEISIRRLVVRRNDGDGPGSTVERVDIRGDVAVLVSDMSGFTRLTRKHGAHHFASLIMMMRTIVWPVLDAGSPLLVLPHADNFYVVYRTAAAAVSVACAAAAALAKYNEGKEDDDKVVIGAIGVAYGRGVRSLGHELVGPTATLAKVLGEDMPREFADDVDVLVSQEARDCIASDPNFSSLEWQERSGVDPASDQAIAAAKDAGAPDTELPSRSYLKYSAITNVRTNSVKPLSEVKPYDPADHGPADEVRMYGLCMERLKAPLGSDERAAVDTRIKESFFKRKTALMFGQWGFENLTKRRGVDHMLKAMDSKVSLIAARVQEHGGEMAEDLLAFFDEPLDAFLCAVELQEDIMGFNLGRIDIDRLPNDAIGIHSGDVLFISGSPVHWGDPVNTASKLAEDLGTAGQLLVTGAVRDALVAQPGAKDIMDSGRLIFEEHDAEISGQHVAYFRVTINAVDECEVREEAARHIQTAFRGFKARQRVKRIKEGKESAFAAQEKEDKSATKLQALHRGRSDRARVLKIKEDKAEHEGATKMQAMYRGKQARARVQDMKSEGRQSGRRAAKPRPAAASEEETSAAKVQALYRGKRDRAQVKEMQHGATKVQSAFRGRQSRKKVSAMKEEHASAAKVQAMYRGKKGRSRAEEEAKARREQRMAEARARIDARRAGGDGSGAGEGADDESAAALRIQSVHRGREARRRVATMKEDAALVSAARGEVDVAENKSATSIQSAYRGRRARREVAERRAAKK